jgi:enediyne biosynthesis protein E4
LRAITLQLAFALATADSIAMGRARISIGAGTRTPTRFVEVGGGDASGHSGFIHAGLGRAERTEIRVQWPDGDRRP